MDPIFTFSDFSFGYLKHELLFHDLELKVNSNSVTLIQGDNGSGKTTLCNLMSGLLTRHKGQFLLENHNMDKLSKKDISEKVVLLKQNILGNIVAATPEEDLIIWQEKFRRKCSEDDNEKRMKAFQLYNMEEFLLKPVWELSHGQIKRITLAALLLNSKKFWILDEPFSGLDSKLISILENTIKDRKNKNFGTLIVSHRSEFHTDFIDEIYRIENQGILKV